MNVTARWITRLILILVLVLIAAGIKVLGKRFLRTDDRSVASYVFDSFAMGTVLTVKVRAADKTLAEKAAELASAEMHRIHKIFDPNDPESEISYLNQIRGSESVVSVSSDMARVLGEALHIRKLSQGTFEPTLGELIQLWGFNDQPRRPRIPDTLRLAALADSLSGAEGIELIGEGTGIRIAPGTGALDVGGIAKGYGVDRVVAVLAGIGIKNALVNLGGEIGVLGVGSNGRSWRIGVQHPRKNNYYLGVIDQVEGMFVATSGDYERFFIEKGRRYHHILDPATGYPASRNTVSVTVIASSCLMADALATSAFVMGPEEGIRFLDSLGVHGLVVYAADGDTESGNLAYSNTRNFLRIMEPDLDGLPINPP